MFKNNHQKPGNMSFKTVICKIRFICSWFKITGHLDYTKILAVAKFHVAIIINDVLKLA